MTKTELIAKLENAENVQALLSEVQSAETDEKVVEILKQHGVEITAEEIESILSATDELDEELLEAVAGGCGCGWLRKVIVWGVNCILKAAGVDVRMECC